MLRPGTPLRRLPLHATDGRLLGGLDLAATLRAGRPVAERGILAETDGGVVLVADGGAAVARDHGTAGRRARHRDGGAGARRAQRPATRRGSASSRSTRAWPRTSERRPPSWTAWLFHLDLADIAHGGSGAALTASRRRWRRPGPAARGSTGRRDAVEALCRPRRRSGSAPAGRRSLALRAARAPPPWPGGRRSTRRTSPLAGRLVLAPRATALPQAPEERA